MNLSEVVTLFSRYLHRVNDIDVCQFCGLAAGTSDETVQTTKAIVYQLYNEQITFPVTDNIPMTTCAEQAISTFCYYLVSINTAGTAIFTKGTDNVYALPSPALGYTSIGALKVTTDGSTTFTMSTTSMYLAGLTVEYFDIDCGIATTLINQGMRKVEHGVTVDLNGFKQRVSNWDHMKVRTTLTINSGDYLLTNSIPNYKEFIAAHITDASGFTYPRLIKDDALMPGMNTPSRPFKISRLPNIEATLSPDIIPVQSFRLWPVCDATYTLDLDCYQYSPILDGVIYSTNWWTQNAPEALVFAALVEAQPYLREDERVATWKQTLDELLSGLAAAQKDERWSGSLVNIRFEDPFNSGNGNIYSLSDW